MKLAILVPVTVLVLLASWGCDEKRYDFTCTGTWARGDKQLSEKVYKYAQLTHENEAVRLCSDDMMQDRPKRGKSAKCECKGE